MNHKQLTCLGASLLLSAAGTQAQTIAAWNFSAPVAAPYNSPAATTGSGTATMLGMNNAYNGGNTASGDVVATLGTANASFSENLWRVRGTTHNGWATAAAGAAQYSQGIELDVSTAGYNNVGFSFDWYSTTQGIRDLQFQYNLNTGNAGGWVNFGGTSPTGTYIAMPNDYYNAPGSPTISLNLGSLADNDANFGIRLVSAFDSTGHIVGDYAGASLTAGQTTLYNNSSGNWRFGNLDFTGTAAPEPSTFALVGMGVSALAFAMRRRKA